MRRLIACCVLALAATAPPVESGDEQFTPLFNGVDLAGWVNVNCAPSTFSAKEGMIVSTGIPTGIMRTEKMYENFILELEWRHMKPAGNAGVFLWGDAMTAPGTPFARGIEVQVLDHGYAEKYEKETGMKAETFTGHGDVFAIHGATMKPDRPHPKGAMRCLPSEFRCKPSPEWNHYRIECNNGVVKLAVNGKEVSGGSECKPRKGYLCLESEGSECHFRNIRIRELPSTGATPEETAELAAGFQSLYTGVDLAGWKAAPGHQRHWQPADWILNYDGKSEADDKNLWSEKEYGNFVLICDWKLNAAPQKVKHPVVLPSGEYDLNTDGTPKEIEVDDAGDSGIYLRGNTKSQVNIWCWPVGSGEVYGYRTDKTQPADVRAGVTPKVRADKPLGQWNRFVITMKGDRLTVVLNGQLVIENAQLPGIPPRGPIALQHHGGSVQFSNVFVKELE
jgi:Domain of Unknown Function (DUF1080)